MNWDRIKGSFKQLRGRAKQTWGKMLNDDATYASGRRDQLEGKVQEGYGQGKDKIEKTVDKITDSL